MFLSSTFSIVAEWCWLNENTGEWTNYDSEISKKLEDNYVRKTADKVYFPSCNSEHFLEMFYSTFFLYFQGQYTRNLI